jgi:hypothetical protein
MTHFGRRLPRLVLMLCAALVMLFVFAPAVEASVAPKITNSRFWLSYKPTSSGVAKTYINARLTVRDDSKGYLKFSVREQQPAYDWRHYRAFWRHAPRYFGVLVRSCKLTWPAPSRFWGGGFYKIKITVRDRDNSWSGPVYHQWNIGD